MPNLENRPILFLDMDDTLMDTAGHMSKIVENYHGDRTSAQVVWNYIARTEDHFFLNPRPFDGLGDFLRGVDDWCAAREYDLQILTALPSLALVRNSIEDKLEWVSRHVTPVIGRDLKVNFGPYSRDKSKWARRRIITPPDILIDDRRLNIEQWNDAGGLGILHRSFDTTLQQLHVV